MKQLSTVLNNISHTAETMEFVPAEQKYLLTKEDGKMIIAEMEQFKVLKPSEQLDNALTLLQRLVNLPKAPRRSYEFNESGEYEPPIIVGLPEDAKGRSYARAITEVLCQPISKKEFAMLYAKLKVLCKWHSVPADEKMIMVAYYDELSKYPASLVREAMKPKYEWFPSFAELEKDIKQTGEHLLKMKEMFLK